jgi:LysM repeat protein
MKLAKLNIVVDEARQPIEMIEVLFNPQSISITQSGWATNDTGLVAKPSVDSSLSVELFFDTSLPQPTENSRMRQGFSAVVGRSSLLPSMVRPKDVREHTEKICKLTHPHSGLGNQDGMRPPICQLYWGNWGNEGKAKTGFLFQGVLTTVTQTLTRFSEDGTALRATLNCEFTAWEDPEVVQKGQNPIDDPIRVVKRGETLTSIAAEVYGDPSLWRVIALENRMDNPRQLQPGDQLTVPPLRTDSLKPGGHNG